MIGGYLLVWTLFGAIAHLSDLGVHQLLTRSSFLRSNAWLISVLTLVIAGVYQFSALKYSCLKVCGSPLSLIVQHWRGRHPQREALWLGIHHGTYCVGCCWSLMLLMFAFGCGNVAWMVALGLVMGAEKNFTWGQKLSHPLGVALVAAGLLVAALSV